MKQNKPALKFTSKAEDVVLPQEQANRTLKQNRELGKRSSVIWKLYMTERVSQISGERLDYSINSAGATGYLYRRKMNLYLIPYF